MGQNGKKVRRPSPNPDPADALVGLTWLAEEGLRRAYRTRWEKFRDIATFWPGVLGYLAALTVYERLAPVVWYRQFVLIRDVDGEPAARRYHETHIAPYEKRFVAAMVRLGGLLSAACYGYGEQKLQAAIEEGAAGSGAEKEAVEFFDLTKALESRLQQYRRTNGCSLDLTALFEAWSEANVAAKEGIEEWKAKGPKDPLAAWLADLPLVGLSSLRKRTASLFRSAYVGESPQKSQARESLEELEQRRDEDMPRAPSAEDVFFAREGSLEEQRKALVLLKRKLDGLPGRQVELLLNYAEALQRGYRLSSKLRFSMRQWWGDNYDANRRMLTRIRRNHPELVEKLEDAYT
jgi:hypothetical protein